MAVEARPEGFGVARAAAGLRFAVADFGAAGAPGFGAPTLSGEADGAGLSETGGGTVVSSSRRRSPSATSTALRATSVAESISFLGMEGIGA